MSLNQRLSLLALAAGLAGCAAFAGKTDYRDYRSVVRSQTEQERLIAERDYLARNPSGQWAEEIRADRARLEPGLFEASKSTAGGLRWYLEVYPEGQFVAQAERRLAALSSVETSRQDEETNAAEVREERREEALERRRQWGTQAITFWTRTLLSVENWGAPIGEVAAGNQAFNESFGAAPRPRCNREECIKFYELDFAVPVPGRTRIERKLRILLRLRLNEGNLVRAEMLLPNRGFSRWFELENEEFIPDGDPESRQVSINWALERVIPVVREVTPTAAAIDVVPEPIDPPTVTATEDEAAPTSDGELVLPLALQGLQTENLRVVLFSASDDDEGPAYDGIFIERIPEADTSDEPAE